jgi:YD repeat-containing protein
LVLAMVWLGPARARAGETREYDVIGRLHRVTYSNGGIIEYNYDGRGNILSIVTTLGTTGVDAPTGGEGARFALGPATPNPGSGVIQLGFSLPKEEHAVLRIYDAAGRRVATLADGTYGAGEHPVRVSAPDWSPGVYFYRLEAGGRTLTRKLVIIP